MSLLNFFHSYYLSQGTIKLSSCDANQNMDCLEVEKEALLKFKQGLTDSWCRLSSWVREDYSKWRGVSCYNSTGSIIKLKLGNPFPNSLEGDGTVSELGGEINPSLLHLKYLNYLDISMNNFEGMEIPKFIGSLGKLRYLNLSGASFGGMISPSIANLSNLHYLDLNTHYRTKQEWPGMAVRPFFFEVP